MAHGVREGADADAHVAPHRPFDPWLVARSLLHWRRVSQLHHQQREAEMDAEHEHENRFSGDEWGLHPSDMNPCFIRPQYAVRGDIYLRAVELKAEGREITYCNIGNPQSVGQAPIKFYRNVLALCLCPHLLDHPSVGALYPEYAVSNAKRILGHIPGGLGAYSDSRGVPYLCQQVAKYIERRDGPGAGPADYSRIFMTDGASVGVKMILSALVSGPESGILCPVPQYPLYSATLSILDGTLVPYYLDEESGWSLSIDDLQAILDAYRKKGVTCKALCFINPGNPTGQCLSMANLQALIRFAAKERLVLLADEVYQENVYGDVPFTSARKALLSLPREVSDECQLVSFHTISKGTIGECGLRGGYFELTNVSDAGLGAIYKMASINLCPNLPAQVVTSLYLNPPEPGEAGHEEWSAERGAIFDALTRKAAFVSTLFNAMDGVTCQPVAGAMYAFPRIHLPEAFVREAEQAGKAPDGMYCMELLEATGIATVPGSGFGQKKGTFHCRTTILPSEDKMRDMMQQWGDFHRAFMVRHTSSA